MSYTENESMTHALSFPLPDLEMIEVKGGSFMMGDDASREKDEKPAHQVELKYIFYIGRFLVTQQLYQAIMETNPSQRKGARRPVEKVSWNDAHEFINQLNENKAIQTFLAKEKIVGKFRLPTEAEWEYAARGGEHNQGYEYCGSDDLKQVGWYRENSGNETKPVGLLYPNELGLYDMSGNVYEWCEDDWHEDYDKPNRPDDGSAWIDVPDRGATRVVRGGNYFNSSVGCRPAYRFPDPPGIRYIGFRVVFSPS